MRSFVAQRHVDADDVAPRQERVEVDELDAMVRRLLDRHVRVVAHDGHLEPAGAVRDGEPDLAEPDEAERLAAHLDALERRPLPFAAAHGSVRGRDSPGEAQQQRERMLGGRDRVAGRGIHDRDAGARGRVEVDVVDADTRTTDDDEPRPGLDERRVDPDLAADEQRVVVGDRRPQLVRRQARSDVDVVTSLQDVDALVGDGLCDEDAHPEEFLTASHPGHTST